MPDAPPPPADEDPVTKAAHERLREVLGEDVAEACELGGRHPWIRVGAANLRAAARTLRDDPALRYDCCHLISAVDWPDEDPPAIDVVYHLVSYARRPEPSYRTRTPKNDGFLVLKVRVPREAPEVPTVMDLWTGADWHERETWDLMGVRFTGRAELTRVLLPEDWPGHPLRKDWVYPARYHGVPIIPPEGL